MGSRGEHIGLNFDSSVAPGFNPSFLGNAGSSGGEGDTENQDASGGNQEAGNNPPLPSASFSSSTIPPVNNPPESAPLGGSQDILPPPADEVSGLRNTVIQVQKDINALSERLFPHPRRTEGSMLSSATTNPYSININPPLPPSSAQGIGPWPTLPALFSDSNLASSSPLVPKKPEIADVVPGHSADLFTSREWKVASFPLRTGSCKPHILCIRWIPGQPFVRGRVPP